MVLCLAFRALNLSRISSFGFRISAAAAALFALVNASPAAAQDKVTYQDHVLPVFRNTCLNCHNPEKKKAGLDLSSYTGALTGSENGKVIEPGDDAGSLLFRLVSRTEEPFMPPKGDKIPDKDLETIKRWILGGVLENAGSNAIASTKPKVDLKVAATGTGKPDGPPPMPGTLVLEPVVHATRPGQLLSLATSPWAPLAALGGQKQVLLYNTESCELLGVLPFPEGTPHVLKFSRSGKLLLAGGGIDAKTGKVVLFDVTTGNRVTELGDEFDAVLAADITPDQAFVAIGGPGKVVKILSTASGATVKSIKKHTDWVTALAYSPDGVLLATGDRAGGLFVWEGATGGAFYTLNGHKSAVTSVCFRGDSNVLASASEDGTVKLWDMASGNEVKSWQAHGGGVQSVHFTHDGRIATCGRDRLVRLWKPDGGGIRQLDPAFDDIALHAAFDHDGKRAIGGDWTGKIRVWTVEDGKPVGELTHNPPTLAQRLAEVESRLGGLQSAQEKAQKEYAAAQQLADKAKAEADGAATELAKLVATDAARKKAADAAAQAAASAKTAAEARPDDAALVKLASDAKAAAERLAAESGTSRQSAEQAAKAKADAAKAAADAATKLKPAADAAAAQLVAAQRDKARFRAAQVYTSLDAARKELAQRQAEQTGAPAMIQAAQQAAEKAKADVVAFEKKTAEAPQRLAAAEQAVKQAQENLNNANKATQEPARLQALRETLLQQSTDLATTLAKSLEKEKDNANLKQATDQAKAAAATLEKELIAARTNAGKVAAAAEAAKGALAKAQEAVAKEKADAQNAPKNLEALKKRVADAEADIPKAQQFAAEAPAKTTAAQAKVDQLNAEYEKLLKEVPAAPAPVTVATK